MFDHAMPSSPIRLAVLHALQRIEGQFGWAFGSSLNPWHHLGALSFFLFWIITVSGIYVYALFDTSVAGAYRSVEYLSREQWYLGGVMRGLHRYASDAFVITMLLHLLREYLKGNYRGFRWFSWISGVPLLWFVYASGIGGYWLVWDRLAQFSAIASAEWLDWLALFSEPLVRNFLTPDAVTDRFFSLLMFLHIGIPLFLLLGMWVHIQRISRPATNPPALLAVGTLLALLALALVWPAVSQAPADLKLAPGTLDLDWFYLFFHPLMYATSPGGLWALATAATAILLVLPLLSRARTQPVAVVSLDNCNGCGRCAADCPYEAIVLQPRSDGKRAPREAVVIADLCASCGICAGACPFSTPFRSIEQLVTGIDLPQLPISQLRAELERTTQQLIGPGRVVVFGCACAASLDSLKGPNTAVFSLPCIGMLPPAFVEYALRAGAEGVLITGCRAGDCAYRLGNTWMEQRLRAKREPHLRSSVPVERVRVAWAGSTDRDVLAGALNTFRASLATLESLPPGRGGLTARKRPPPLHTGR